MLEQNLERRQEITNNRESKFDFMHYMYKMNSDTGSEADKGKFNNSGNGLYSKQKVSHSKASILFRADSLRAHTTLAINPAVYLGYSK